MSKIFMQFFIYIFLSICTIILFVPKSYTDQNDKSQFKLPTDQIIKSHGFEVESHTVTTQDGYILNIFRIPSKKKEYSKNYPVLFQHCFLGSSADFVLGGPEKSLPMQLANAGYDVWLANSRGNTYGKAHNKLKVKSCDFWNFNLQQLATIDLPDTIDYVLETTEAQQVHFVGYSLGTTLFFIMASEKPGYMSKIRSNISLAPMANIIHSTSIVKSVCNTAGLVNFASQYASYGEFTPKSVYIKVLVAGYCLGKLDMNYTCTKTLIDHFGGNDPENFDMNIIRYITGHFPAGTSSILYQHYCQFMLTATFGQMDYGGTQNKKIYGTVTPPQYNISLARVPISLYYAPNDILSNTEDVLLLKKKLPMIYEDYQVENLNFNHMGFLWSKFVTDQINKPVIATMNETDAKDWIYTGLKPKPQNDEKKNASYATSSDTEDVMIE